MNIFNVILEFRNIFQKMIFFVRCPDIIIITIIIKTIIIFNIIIITIIIIISIIDWDNIIYFNEIGLIIIIGFGLRINVTNKIMIKGSITFSNLQTIRFKLLEFELNPHFLSYLINW